MTSSSLSLLSCVPEVLCWPYSRFPGGIPKLARYIHDRGLQLGIYGDLGTFTCMGYPGTTLDTIETDAQTFADWGIDMLKLDGCYSNATEQEKGEEPCCKIQLCLLDQLENSPGQAGHKLV